MREAILKSLESIQNGYKLCGVVDRKARVYPLGTDTKVISALFEIVSRQAVQEYANKNGLELVEPKKQNHYPDFTLVETGKTKGKIAIDVKTTYKDGNKPFSFTLGSYTSYIRKESETKNILYPYNEYDSHWILGFAYKRNELDKKLKGKIYAFDTLNDIPLPFGYVDVFMQEKWKIAGDSQGSGNTANIGSIKGTIQDFIDGNGKFKTEGEFLQYWRGYKETAEKRKDSYSNIHEFRAFMLEQE